MITGVRHESYKAIGTNADEVFGKYCAVVRENAQGEIVIEYKRKPLAYAVCRQKVRQAEAVSSKQLAMKLDGLAYRPVRQEAQAVQSTA